MESLHDLIKKYSEKAEPNSFLQHVEYFKEDDKITTMSITNKWFELSEESKAITFYRGAFTIHTANGSEKAKGCPYAHSFETDRMMKCIKHPADTGIVNEDGSINVDILKTVMENHFSWNEEKEKYILPKSVMKKYMKECKERDKNTPLSAGFYIPFHVVADAEWDAFYYNFADYTDDDEDPVIFAETFLMFYFNSTELYKKKLDDNKKNKKS